MPAPVPYARPDPSQDNVTWVGQGSYERPNALQDEPSFAASGGGQVGPQLVVEIVGVSARIGDWMGVYGSFNIQETAEIGVEETVTIISDLSEFAAAGHSTSTGVWVLVDDFAVLADSVLGTARTGGTVTENLRIRDSVVAARVVRQDTTSSAVLGDASSAGAFAAEVEVARIGDAVSPKTLAVGTLTSRATIRGFGFTQQPLFIQDAAVVQDEVQARTRGRVQVTDTAQLLGLTQNTIVARQTENDVFGGFGTAENNVLATGDVQSRMFIFDTVAVSGEPMQIWTANSWTWAMSTYTDLPLQDMTQTMAAGSDGLYFPGSAPVPVRVVTGNMDFGEPMKKRVPWFYMSGVHDRPLVLSVSAVSGAALITVSYTETRRFAETDRTTRVQIGKGFNSNYYQFAISGESPMALYGCEAVVAPSSRRI